MRTEEEKVIQAGIKVKLGGKEYEVKPLVIKEAREWRKKLSALISKLPAYVGVTTDDPKGFEEAINAMLSSMPDEMANLFFSYAKDLNRDEIESTATEEELATAIEAVMAVAFPLARSLTGALKTLAQ